jgi:hypothetical protein
MLCCGILQKRKQASIPPFVLTPVPHDDDTSELPFPMFANIQLNTGMQH